MKQARSLVVLITTLVISGFSQSTASGALFTAEKYPVSVTASAVQDRFDFFGSAIPCETTLTGSLAAASKELVLSPTFKCTAFGGSVPVTTVPESIQLTADGALHLTEEFQIDMWMAGSKSACPVHVQPGTASVLLTNEFPNIRMAGTAKLSAIQTRLSPICPSGTEGSFSWTLQAGGISLKGVSEGLPTPISVD